MSVVEYKPRCFAEELALTNPEVSVLMQVRDGDAFIGAALASLAKQSLRNFELIVVDSASTDRTPQILREWMDRDPRMRVLRMDRIPLGAGLNHAARLARAPLLARLDADDLARPDRLALQASAMARYPQLALLGSAALLIDGSGRVIGRLRPPLRAADIRRVQQTSCAFIHSSIMIRAAVFRRVGGYRDGLHVSEDYDLWSRISDEYQVANLPQYLTGYRVHGGSLTSSRTVRMAIASMCVAAAARARGSGAKEPFISGTPSLRKALPLLSISRKQARRIIVGRYWSVRISRSVLQLPVTPVVKRAIGEVGRLIRLRLLYRKWLVAAHAPLRSRPSRSLRRPFATALGQGGCPPRATDSRAARS